MNMNVISKKKVSKMWWIVDDKGMGNVKKLGEFDSKTEANEFFDSLDKANEYTGIMVLLEVKGYRN